MFKTRAVIYYRDLKLNKTRAASFLNGFTKIPVKFLSFCERWKLAYEKNI